MIKTFIFALLMVFSVSVCADMIEGDFTGTITIPREDIKSIKWTKEELIIKLEEEEPEDITIEWSDGDNFIIAPDIPSGAVEIR